MDKYGYIGIETLLNFCENSKDHAVTPNDFMRMNRVRVPERNKGEWVGTEFDGYADGPPVYYEWKCSACGCVVEDEEPAWNFCPNCGAKMNGDEQE